VNTPPQTNNISKNGKKKKTVTWAPDAQLESVRLIERAVYDDDPQEVSNAHFHQVTCSEGF
jgi:protein phosphatase 1 regulatory subunit 10